MDSIEDSQAVHPSSSLWITTLLVKNIHCPSCMSYAQDVLRSLPDIQKVEISLIDQTVRVQHGAGIDLAQRITQELSDAAFEVQHASARDARGRIQYEYELPEPAANSTSAWTWPKSSMSKAQRKHIENCNACKSKVPTKPQRARKPRQWALASRVMRSASPKHPDLDLEKANSTASLSDASDLDDKQPDRRVKEVENHSTDKQQRWISTIGIEGMTCASCVGTITNILEPMSYVVSVNINLLANNGVVQFMGPRNNVVAITEAVEDAGYGASVIEVHEIKSASSLSQSSPQTSTFRLSMSIEGMTCASCVGAITRGLEAFPFVSKVNIDLMGNKGIVEFEDESNKAAILEKVDDLGYDAVLLECELLDGPSDTRQEREVTITVEGTYCPNCPENIRLALDKNFGATVIITRPPSEKDPRVTVRYIPAPPAVTIREIIATIKAADVAFSASIYNAPSDEERSSIIRRRHQNEILRRLLLAIIVAIPTFIIGIIYMSLVSNTNHTRRWFQEPIWAGNVTRQEWALFIMTTPVMFYSASGFHEGALKDIRSLWRKRSKVPILRRFYRFGSMNLLISLGTTVAYLSSLAVLIMDALDKRDTEGRSSDTYFDSVTFLTMFLLIGRFLEAYTKAKTGEAVNMLANLKPSEAYLVRPDNGKASANAEPQETAVSMISTDMLEVGDVVSIPLGNSPPTDGTIKQEGTFLFDESSLTGEAKPVKKTMGDQVFAGTVNMSHPVRMIVTELGGTSMLDKIVAVVREGQGKRAPIERIADVITGYFAPVVTLIAIITWVVWLSLGEGGVLPKNWLDVQQGGWAFWSLEFAIAVFVVACPCGIGLAAPTALYVGGGLAAKDHILVQGGGEAFQEASNMDVVVFDKTGTLTEGKMQVNSFDILDDSQDAALALAISKALEESSTHPIAIAISGFCDAKLKGLPALSIDISEIQEVSGSGMKGIFTVNLPEAGNKITYEATLGNQRFPTSEDTTGLSGLLTKYQNLGQSIATLSIRRTDFGSVEQSTPIAVFAITDPLRPTTASVMQTLQYNHNLSVHMCTGDNAATARSIALQLGIPIANVRANVLPHEKAEYIKSLQDQEGKRKIVAFVGDGTNDTPALAAADVSIALSSGSDVAITQASFILLNSDLETILKLVKLAKRVFWRVKMNFIWAAIYNVCLIPVAAGVTYPAGRWRLGPVWASAAMAASSVSVVCSSLALKIPEIEFEEMWRRVKK